MDACKQYENNVCLQLLVCKSIYIIGMEPHHLLHRLHSRTDDLEGGRCLHKLPMEKGSY